jgi:flagellar hook-associated protein 1
MSDMLSTAVSGLKAFQRALDTTSHNIANVSTPGYSRQAVNITTQEPQALGGLNIGKGVKVSSIDRYYDSLLTTQMRSASSSYERLDIYANKAGTLSNLFSDSATGLTASLQKFTNAVQGVANAPTSSSARQVLLSEAEGLTQRLKTYDARLDEIDADVSARLVGEAAAITNAAASIAKLNEQIVTQQAATGQPPNDLMDARDKALTELATHVNVTTVTQDDGALNVFIGNGQSLVVGSEPAKIGVQADPYQANRSTLVYETPNGNMDLRGVLSGGTVGGLMDFRREMLDPARNQIGQIAVGVASAVNAQHREGMDLSGNMGTDLFAVGGVPVLPKGTNNGSGSVAVARGAAGALTPNDYILTYAGGAWNLRQADTGAAVAMTGAGSSASPFVAAGLSFVVGGTPADGDSYLVQPTAGAIDGMKVLITDPSSVAAAAPIRTAVATGNAGTGTITAGEVLDATNSQLPATTVLQFTDATHYSVNGSGNFTYTPGGNIDLNGWRVAISGAPEAGDSFTVGKNTGGVGDNRNALELAAAFRNGVLSNGTESLNAAGTRLVSSVGVAANQATVSRDSQQIIYEDSSAAVNEVSGVNLDEEAANLMRYQQAYQAAAQVIRVTQEMFDSLLAATRR